MKANELMIGDWIRFSETADWVEDLRGEPVQVEGLRDEDGAIKIIDPRPDSKFRDFWSDDENDFEPIPLTAEILEKNGMAGLYGRNWPSEKDPNIELTSYEDGRLLWTINYNEYYIMPFKYVHELQHALRLCGVEKEIVLN